MVRVSDGETLTTDGPYIVSKQVFGGFTIIEAPDKTTAIDWARKAARATTLLIEGRPF